MTEQQTDWRELLLAVGDLEEGFSEYRLPLTDKLVDQQFKLFPDNASDIYHLHFHSQTELTWGDSTQPKQYTAFELRTNIFFIDWLEQDSILKSMSIVLDLEAQEATLLHTQLPSKAEAKINIYDRILKQNQMSAVKIEISHAGISQPRQQKIHQRTTELIGKRLKHTYSQTHAFEHIYLNDKFFAWQSLAGPDKGMADVEPVNYIKIASELYLFNWYERLVPWSGVFLMDLAQNRSIDKIHYYADLENFQKIAYLTIGSYIQLFNETNYE